MALERRLLEALGGECEIYTFGLAARSAEGESWVHEMHDRLARFFPTSELSRLRIGRLVGRGEPFSEGPTR